MSKEKIQADLKPGKKDKSINQKIKESDIADTINDGPEEILEKEEKKKFYSGFLGFLKQYSIIGLAIGLVIGNSSQSLVKTVVEGIITPLISVILNIFLPTLGTLSEYAPTIPIYYNGINEIHFKIGALIQSSLEFTIVLLIIYLIVKGLLKRDDLIIKEKK